MALTAGARIGPYEIIASIGAGGMGEVYRARDTKLARDVAIKVLPDSFSADPERLARFRREALVLASLNHPHIATVYGLEDAAGQPALVMELVEGPTLAERLAHGPLPMDEALGLARQIAEGLDAAHGRGVIHRDLKPLNIKITPEGSVKTLDFGLAKVAERDPGSAALAHSPTVTSPAMTAMGVLLGTAAYMAPEQARGRAADHRADIWAFGCVLYEMLTGRQAFGGAGIPDVLGTILHKDPDWSPLPADTPAPIRRLLARCLQKPLERRLHSLGDAVIEIDDALSPSKEEPVAGSRVRRWVAVAPWVVAAVCLVALLLTLARPRSDVTPPLSKLAVSLPQPMIEVGRPPIAVSPDGTRLVVVGQQGNTRILYSRLLDAFETSPVSGTEGAVSPFFSPDGEWIGFYSGGRLKKVSIRGGPPVTLARLTDFMGASWREDGTIVASVDTHELTGIPAAGGDSTSLLAAAAGQEQVTRRLPCLLPGGRAVLLNIVRGPEPQGSVGVRILESGEEKILVPDATHPSYIDGYLIFARSGTLFAVRFDVAKLTIVGTPVPVLEGVAFNPSFGATHYAVSAGGRLAYARGAAADGRLLSTIDRKGVVGTLTDSQRAYLMPRVSPDGRRIALTILDGGSYSIWNMTVDTGSLSRLAPASFDPVWSPDGRRLALTSAEGGGMNLAVLPSNGSGPPVRVLADPSYKLPTSWTPDGKWIVFTRVDPAGSTGEDIYLIAPDGGDARPFLQSPHNETSGVVSPDGKWLAFGRGVGGGVSETDVSIASFSNSARQWRVAEGLMPAWSPDGRELFFLSGAQRNRLMAVEVAPEGDGLRLSKPRLIVEQSMMGGIGFGLRRYDVMPDGQRFVFATPDATSPATEIRIVLDWRAELERTVSGRR